MKMPPGSALEVSLQWGPGDGQPVGRLAFRGGLSYLEYDPSFIQSGLELSPVHHKTGHGLHRPHDGSVFHGLHGVFNDSLPDGWGRLLVDRRARQLGIEPATLTPLDRLACVAGQGIGALRYSPATDIWHAHGVDADLDRLANDARLVLQGNVGDVISELGYVGGSPGGARPKALLAIDDTGRAVHGSDSVPSGYGHYIVKFPGKDDPRDVAHIEQAYARMAHAAGVTMPETVLLPGRRDRFYFAARRFERDGGKRVHVHSASGLLYADFRIPSLDYQDLIRLTRFVTRDQRDCRAMFTLAVFNVLAHNRDDHARQFSFTLTRDGTWRLAPAYDLTFSPGSGGEHSTSVLGHGKDISRGHLLALASTADLPDKEAVQIIDAVQGAVADWDTVARECGVSDRSRKRVAKALIAIRA
jgi:serine/threonine-protein kinase HipA